jgi:hypothetical protein
VTSLQDEQTKQKTLMPEMDEHKKKKKKKKNKARRLITILKRTNKYGIQVPTSCYLCFQLSFHTNYRILQHKQEEQNSKHLKSKEATLI